MTLLERNIEALRRRQPELAARVSACRVGASLVVRASKAGPPTLEVAVPGKGPVLLHSAYDPVKEAQRLAAAYEEARTENIVVLGLGLGYHVIEYLKREHHWDFALVVEPDLERFRCCLEHTDFSELVGPHNIWFAVGLAPLDVFQMLKTEECTLVRNGLKAFKHPASISLCPEYYRELVERLHDLMLYTAVNNSSRDKSWRHFATNMVRNMPAAMKRPGVQALFGVFEGVPGIVVSAGPSLGKNVRELAHAKGRAVIIAVDTALRVLLDHGIEPDLVVSIDFSSRNLRYFEGVDTSRLRLVVDSEVFPAIVEAFEGPCFYAEIANKSASRWLARALGPRGGLDKGLSVAHTAFLLAIEMGCRPIAFVGQDLAYTGNVSHAKGAAMARVERCGHGEGNLISVPDIFGRPVPSHASMVVFLRHFEQLLHASASRLPDGCVDATEGGARIAGTRLMTLKDFIARSCTRRVDVGTVLDHAAAQVPLTSAAQMLAEVDAMRRELKALAREAAACRSTLRAIVTEIGARRRDPARIARLQTRYAKETAWLESHTAPLELLADALTRAMTIVRDRRLSPALIGTLDAAAHVKAVGQFMTVMDDIVEAAEFWLRLLHDVRTDIAAQGTAVTRDAAPARAGAGTA
jgi:hypothetical protein